MRLVARRLLGFGLLLGALALALRRKQVPVAPSRPPIGAGGQPQSTPQRERPRGFDTVAIVLCGAVLAALAGYGWDGIRQHRRSLATAIAMTGGEPGHAPDLLVRYGCGGCHAIPGVPGADGKVGPSLADLRGRVYVGGVALNTAANLVGWIVDPQRFSPRSAMPATGITEAEARDVAAYLYAQ